VRGRPRSFDADGALDAALQVFWEKGYEGASLADLTKSMGITRPSLYAAFGDKEALFRQALDRYLQGPGAYVKEALDERTARAVAEKLLLGAAKMLGDPRHPRGCLAVQGALACREETAPVQRELTLRRKRGEGLLRRRLQLAKAEGDLPSDADPAELASYIATVMHGMSVQAAGGASRSELQRIAKTALRAWPA
jgi:AcrR family transcriptional regulator